jgi:hypothetical protein
MTKRSYALDPFLTLYDPYGSMVAYNDDNDDNGGNGTPRQIAGSGHQEVGSQYYFDDAAAKYGAFRCLRITS